MSTMALSTTWSSAQAGLSMAVSRTQEKGPPPSPPSDSARMRPAIPGALSLLQGLRAATCPLEESGQTPAYPTLLVAPVQQPEQAVRDHAGPRSLHPARTFAPVCRHLASGLYMAGKDEVPACSIPRWLTLMGLAQDPLPSSR